MSEATVIFIAGWTGGLVAQAFVPWTRPLWPKILLVMAISIVFRLLGEFLA